MPRLPTSLLRKAHTIDSLLPPLLGPCRDLRAAQNELRWLREHVDRVARPPASTRPRNAKQQFAPNKTTLLRQLVKERARGKPLQYILGTEYFGDLEIKCRPGVLIPRQDTAASITHLTHLLRAASSLPPELRVLDLCTGTGCIPLLLAHEFHAARTDIALRVLGVDISEAALNLAQHNLQRARKAHPKTLAPKPEDVVEFLQADVLADPFAHQVPGRLNLYTALNFHRKPQFWDVLVANPPYVSRAAYWRTTTRSVRGFEPRLALVPPSSHPPAVAADKEVEEGDEFYPRLLRVACDVEAKVVLLEVADLEQALRVARMAKGMGVFDGVEIWRDLPGQGVGDERAEDGVEVLGQGNARSLVCWRGVGAEWLGKGTTVSSQGGQDAERVVVDEERLQPGFSYDEHWRFAQGARPLTHFEMHPEVWWRRESGASDLRNAQSVAKKGTK